AITLTLAIICLEKSRMGYSLPINRKQCWATSSPTYEQMQISNRTMLVSNSKLAHLVHDKCHLPTWTHLLFQISF
ncbi:hypothetical protein KJ966_13280, partial [bacterium]|nr:hypothetical protein [bacterium]